MHQLIYAEKVQVVLLRNGQNPGQSRVYVMVALMTLIKSFCRDESPHDPGKTFVILGY